MILLDHHSVLTLLLCYDCCDYDQAAYYNMNIIVWLIQGALKLCALNSSKRGYCRKMLLMFRIQLLILLLKT